MKHLLTTMTATIGLALSTQAGAQAVPVCQGLSLYANAVNTGLCRTLSPTTQNLWVCGLTASNPDVHVTFNVATPMHLTVRVLQPLCEGNSTMRGNFPANLALGAGQPQVICGVNLPNYIARLNAVPQLPGPHFVQVAINVAIAGNRVTPAVGQTYINTAVAQHCP